MKSLFNYNRFLNWYTSRKKTKAVAIFIGLLALTWFLVRVIPKPQRAFYPCQRAAFPLATGFLIWFFGFIGSVALFRKSRHAFKRYRIIAGIFLGLIATGILMFNLSPQKAKSFAISIFQAKPQAIIFNQPGTAIVNPASTVSIVQSEKENTTDINSNDIELMVREAVEMAGGLESLISEGQTVVLKPNLLTSRTLPYENTASVNLSPGANGIVTDYRIIQAMVNIIRELNTSGKIILIEGSGVGATRSNHSRIGWDRVTGLDSMIFLEEICEWQDKNSPELVKLSLPAGKALYTNGSEYNVYYMSRVYYEADVLISLPCVKNHSNTGITGAVKNVGIGATPTPIYGWGPNDPNIPNERWNPDNGIDHGTETNRDPLHNWIHDFYLLKPVDFVLMDGLQGLEMGPGAHIGSLSCQKNMRMVLASNDPVAIDAIESLICGQDPARIKHLSSLHRDGAGNLDPRLIRVVGKEVHEVKQDLRIFSTGTLTKYNDFKGPEVGIRASDLDGNILHLDITADEDIAKVEITVAGIKELKTVVDNFYDINFELSQAPDYMSHIEVSVYDQFLNCTKIKLGGTATAPIENTQIELTCYPNPAQDFLVVSFNHTLNEKGQLKIQDATGRVVKTIYLEPGQAKVNVDISKLKTGIYILKSKSNEVIRSTRFIKTQP